MIEAQRQAFPGMLDCIQLESNFGFSRAANEGITAAQTEMIPLLNHDTEADPHWVEAGLLRTPSALRKRLALRRDRTLSTPQFCHLRRNCRPGNGLTSDPLSAGLWSVGLKRVVATIQAGNPGLSIAR